MSYWGPDMAGKDMAIWHDLVGVVSAYMLLFCSYQPELHCSWHAAAGTVLVSFVKFPNDTSYIGMTGPSKTTLRLGQE